MSALQRIILTALTIGGIATIALGSVGEPTAVHAAPGGPVVLGGDDLTDHGGAVGGVNNTGWLYMERSLGNIKPNVTRSNDGSIAALGSSADGGGAGDAILSAATPVGLTVTYYEGGPSITGFFTALAAGSVNPAIIWISGTGAGNDLGDGDGLEPAALTASAGAIASFVNSGGGLMSHGTEYGWLSALLPGAVSVGGGFVDDLYLTSEGTAVLPGLGTTELNAGPWHNHFEGDLGGLDVLVRSNQVDDSTGQDAAVIIGGALVTLTCEDAEIQYAATGDSIPYGADIDPRVPYPNFLLHDHLATLSSACVTNVSASGASTTNYLTGGGDFDAQLQPTFDLNPDLITITVGVDNKLLPTLVNDCLPKLSAFDFNGANGCARAILNDRNGWSSLSTDLTNILAKYRELLPTNPDLVVAITDYYNPVPTQISSQTIKEFCDQLNPGFAGQCNTRLKGMNAPLSTVDQVIGKLNSTIASVLVSMSPSFGGRLVLTKLYDQFKGHCTPISLSIDGDGGSATGNLGCPSADSWIEPAFTLSGSFPVKWGPFTFTISGTGEAGVHPNFDGHECISNLVWESSKALLGSPEAPVVDPCP